MQRIAAAAVTDEANAICSHSRSGSQANPDQTATLSPRDPDLQSVVEAWLALSAEVRVGILAMVRATASNRGNTR